MNWIKKFSIFGIGAIASTIASLAIGQAADARFVIFVAGNDPATLQRVRTVSPNAFATKINDQPVIQAGTFNSETSADSLAISLANSGLTPQKYFSSTGGKESNVPVPFTDTQPVSVNTLPATPQSVVIQQTSAQQPVTVQPESQPQIFNSAPQQSIAYTNNQCLQGALVNGVSSCAQPQYQQITTNTVVPQIQTQQVLVPRWQQVMVPETRQIVTQTVVPQTQIVQTGYAQQSGYIQPTAYVQTAQSNTCVQPTPQSGCVQSGYIQPTAYVQPQTGFIPSSTIAASNYDGFSQNTGLNNGLSEDALLPQASQNPNFRYVAAVPAKSSNQFLLSRVRQYVPNAFFSNSGRGTYIHAGAYQNRDSAESVSRYLRSQGVDSRVLYF
jgi:hypothetical protein